ncbi:HAMP domain-containing sensor histidine kinase [Gilvimarinus sp. SDUM040013]|uniref:histidine kinase n=1 Tax=Gilvimarinus gilvus TaxID=3058038 RepID=A0ABU4S2Z1_9GAMM|nr:HAMP domain-containing sensor histidine kinase [Gilvimarinus sp. SDUM040013]MDO3384911.1 HAMP domain-containing sensor histidine kinase [Gilvimarinus sp. SDUM040013]MDX6851452.1 HAMP domain-containing sensor histidine kinase [Gilvimarinus sp. SDUM040013]
MTLIRSIKHQVMLSLIGLAVSLTLVFSGFVLITAFAVEDALLYRVIDQQAQKLKQLGPGEQAPALPIGMRYYPSLQAAPQSAQVRLARPQNTGELFSADDKHYHYRKIDGETEPAYLIAEVSPLLVVSRQPGLFLLCAVGLGVSLVGAVWLAVVLSRRIVTPILTLTDAAKAAEEPNADTAMPQLPHELGYLAEKMQQSFTALNTTLEKEKAFANNVSHELRTPLAVINNACTLIAQRGYTTTDLDTINRASNQMQHTIDALLAMARSEKASTQLCRLKHHIEQQLMSKELVLPNHWQLSLDIADDIKVNANPRLLDIVLINLLNNALEHCSAAKLSIVADDECLAFTNPAAPSLLQNLTAAGVHNSDSRGIGQGLYLVSRIAEHQGWTLSVNSTGENFVATLTW